MTIPLANIFLISGNSLRFERSEMCPPNGKTHREDCGNLSFPAGPSGLRSRHSLDYTTVEAEKRKGAQVWGNTYPRRGGAGASGSASITAGKSALRTGRFQSCRPRKEDVVFQVNVPVQVRFHGCQFEIEGTEGVASVRRRRVAAGELPHAGQRAAGRIVFHQHHADGVLDSTAVEVAGSGAGFQ